MANSVDYQKLGSLLKAARNNLNLTQKDIAGFLAVTPQTVSSWENGINKIDIDTLQTLCQKYGLNFIHLLTDISNHNPNKKDILNVFETNHLKKYRSLNEDGQRETDNFMDVLLKADQYRAGGKEEFSKPLAPDPTIDYDAAIEEGEAEIARTHYARIAAYGGKNMFVKEAADEEDANDTTSRK